jgi:hypothetical protein
MPAAPAALLDCDVDVAAGVVFWLALDALEGDDEPPPQPAAISASSANPVPIIRRVGRGAVVVMFEPSLCGCYVGLL